MCFNAVYVPLTSWDDVLASRALPCAHHGRRFVPRNLAVDIDVRGLHAVQSLKRLP
jgi:hypothetical protein